MNVEQALEAYDSALARMASLWPEGHGAMRSLRAALMVGQTLFAARDCRVPTHENVLNGLLRAALGDAVDFIRQPIVSLVANVGGGGATRERRLGQWRDYNPVHLFTVDLTVRNREAVTGADMAFIVDGGEVGTPRIGVALLQAKRGNPGRGKTLSIRSASMGSSSGDGQLDKLRGMNRSGFGAAYLFYNNDYLDPIWKPMLPIVQDVRGVGREHVDLRINTVDLASYLLHVVTDPDPERAAAVRWDDPRLADFLGRVINGEPRHIVALSADPDAGLHLNKLLGPHAGKWGAFEEGRHQDRVPEMPKLDDLLQPNAFVTGHWMPSEDDNLDAVRPIRPA